MVKNKVTDAYEPRDGGMIPALTTTNGFTKVCGVTLESTGCCGSNYVFGLYKKTINADTYEVFPPHESMKWITGISFLCQADSASNAQPAGCPSALTASCDPIANPLVLDHVADALPAFNQVFKGPGGTNCDASLKIDTEADCQSAATYISMPYNKKVSGTDRPAGCFWDQNG